MSRIRKEMYRMREYQNVFSSSSCTSLGVHPVNPVKFFPGGIKQAYTRVETSD